MKDSTHFYFAYGSNLNHADWTAWCRRKGYPENLLEPMFPAWLPDRQLRFTSYSHSREGGVLDVVPRLGHIVPGYVFRVSTEGLKALDRKEGAPDMYRQIDAVCLRENSEECPVLIYEVAPGRRTAFEPPSDDYLTVVAAGLKALDLDERPLEAAAKNEDGAANTPGLFVYGTLMRGECRHHLLAAGYPTCILLAEAPGALHDFGDYPGLRLLNRDEPATCVQGEFLRLAQIHRALPELDSVEGFHGFGAQASLYRRTLINVGVGDGRVRQAWTYAPGAATAPVIASGDWRAHLGRKQTALRAIAEAHCCGRPESELAQSLISQDSQDPCELLPIWRALENGSLSERKLAQASGVRAAWGAGPPGRAPDITSRC